LQKTPRGKSQNEKESNRSMSPQSLNRKQITSFPPINDAGRNTNNDAILMSPPPTFVTQAIADPDRPITPYEDRLIPTLRKNRPDKSESNNDITTLVSTKAPNVLLSEENNAVNNTILNTSAIVDENEIEQANGELTERDVREAAQMVDSLGKNIVNTL
jgi:hypothetical protein